MADPISVGGDASAGTSECSNRGYELGAIPGNPAAAVTAAVTAGTTRTRTGRDEPSGV